MSSELDKAVERLTQAPEGRAQFAGMVTISCFDLRLVLAALAAYKREVAAWRIDWDTDFDGRDAIAAARAATDALAATDAGAGK